MPNYIVTETYVSTIGNGLDLPDALDFAYVGPGVMLGTRLSNGYGVYATNTGISMQIAGSVFGEGGIRSTSGGTVAVFDGGSVLARAAAIGFDQDGIVTNAGSISGSYGILSDSLADIVNSGTIVGRFNAINAGSLTLQNSGLISGANTGIFVLGAADITNLGTIKGGIGIINTVSDMITNQGVISGAVTTSGGDDVVDSAGGRFLGIVNLEGGNDTYLGGGFADRVLGGVGQDELSGAGGDDRFYAVDNDGSDDIDGGDGIDRYDASNVTLSVTVNLASGLARIGGSTDDVTGIERVIGGAAKDSLIGDDLANTLSGNAGNDSLTGNAGADRLIGGTGNDSLLGGDDKDRLLGSEGRDLLNGGAGNDMLLGGLDTDVMTGGTGEDRFVFAEFEDFIAVTSGMERITDFVRGQDIIDLSGIDALAAAGDQAFSFVGAGPISNFGQISIRSTATTTFVAVSVNSPAAFEVIRLDGVLPLTAADFVL